MKKIFVLFMFVISLAIVFAHAQFVQAEPAFTPITLDATMPTTDGTVYSIADDGTSTYIGGAFSQVGNPAGVGTTGGVVDAANGAVVAPFPKVTGGDYEIEPGNFTELDGTIYASISDGAGGWYIGGEFLSVGEVESPFLAHINADGSLDTNFDPNPDYSVFALALSGNYLYVGGSFSSIGDQSFAEFARVNKTTGLADASCNPQVYTSPSVPYTVTAIYLDVNNNIYLGGDFTHVGGSEGTPRSGLAKLNSSCELDTDWEADTDGYVHTITGSGSDIYVGGEFNNIDNDGEGGADPLSAPFVAKLSASDGTVDQSFNPLLDGGPVYALALSGEYLYLGGGFATVDSNEIAEFARVDADTGEVDTGCDLDVITQAVFAELDTTRSLTLSEDSIYLGGDFDSVGGEPRSGLAKVSTTTCALDDTFKPIAAANEGEYVYTLAVSGNKLYVGGSIYNIGQTYVSNLAKINNATGAVDQLFTPNPDSEVYALALSGNYLYVGGSFSSIGDQSFAEFARVNKTTGLADASCNPQVYTSPPAPSTVTAIYLDVNNNIYLGGDFTHVGGSEGTPRSGLAKLNSSCELDTDWVADAQKFDEGYYYSAYVRTITGSGSDIYVGGEFNTIDNDGEGGADPLSAPFVAKLSASDGTVDQSFNPLLDGGPVYALALSGEYLYLGGGFATVDSNEIAEFARVDADTGEVDTGCDLDVITEEAPIATVYSLVFNGTTGYVGGSFNSVMSQSINGLFRFDTTSCTLDTDWTPNPYGYIYALSATNQGIWVGGQLEGIEDEPKNNLAHFTLTQPSSTPTPSASPTPTPTTNLSPTPTIDPSSNIYVIIDNILSAEEEVESNIGEIEDPSAATGLFFEKPGFGRIEFRATLDLTDPDVISWLQQLESLLDLSTLNKIGLDADLVQELIDTEATLTMYNVTLNNPKILVDGAEDEEGVVSNLVYNQEADTLTFTAAHFTEFTAVEQTAATSGSQPPSTTKAPSCTDESPVGSPDLFEIRTDQKSTTIFFAPVTRNVNKYYIAYGTEGLPYQHGVEITPPYNDGVISYTINDLNPDTLYHFTVRAGNGCAPGNWSQTMEATTTKNLLQKKSWYWYK